MATALTILAACVLPTFVTAQTNAISYTIHVDFFAYSCSLSITQVTLYDSFGRPVGEGVSPVGGEIAIPISAMAPISQITATAYGIATWGQYLSWRVNGISSVTLGNAGDYWITIRMS
jgi:hypothetical protein